MLHFTGLFVNAAPADFEKIAEEMLKESVFSRNLFRCSETVLRERDAFVGFVQNVTLLCHALQHFCDAWWRKAEAFRYLGRGRWLILLLQPVYCLKIFFDVAAAHMDRI